MVPDVAAKADVKFGYQLTIGGLHVPGCGTSAAAPLWASLVALLNEELKVPVGHVTPLLYDQRSRNGVQAVGHSRAELGSGSWLGNTSRDCVAAGTRSEVRSSRIELPPDVLPRLADLEDMLRLLCFRRAMSQDGFSN